MMKRKGLIAVLICILILSGCTTPKAKNRDAQVNLPPNLSQEEGIRAYLAGEWVFDKAYVSDVICKMSIDEDLNVHLSFHNSQTDESKGDYAGQIKFDRIYAKPDEAPDLLCLELMDTDDPGGDFLFQHKTIYDGMRVMSWFFAGNGNCIFDMLGSEGFEDTPDEIIFEKVTGEKPQLRPRKNDEFYTVFWGTGGNGKSLWLDDVRWTPLEKDDLATLYPRKMTLYENDVPESVLYSIVPDEISEILGDDLFPGEVYFVQTDKQGNITHFISAERKRFLDDGSSTPESKALVFDIIENVKEIKEYLKLGMTIEFDGDTIMLDDEEYYLVILGTKHEEHFVREIFYAVNTYTQEIYRQDVLNDTWEVVAMG